MNTNKKIDNATKRSKQNLSCNWTGTADFGRLVPIHWEELLQGDHVVTCKPRIEMQMLPFASPTFGKIDVYCHYFVVPIRLLQKNFYDIWSQTGQYKNAKLSNISPAVLEEQYRDNFGHTSLPSFRRAYYKHWTSLGLNPFFAKGDAPSDNTPISLYPWLAYNRIWWDFYRDPEVVRDESISQYIFDGDCDGIPDDQSFCEIYMAPHVRSIKNNWISNLFTSDGNVFNTEHGNIMPFPDSTTFPYHNGGYSVDGGELAYIEENASDGMPFAIHPDGDAAPSVNTSRMLRLIESLSRLSERLSLSGKRQIEQLFARYGVKPEWSKINLCRYVGGAKSTVLVDNIISTAETSELPLGAQGGKGYCAMDNLNIQVKVDEPSILMGVLSVMPHIHFVQGLSKKFKRRDLVDMFQSTLQYVGQVAVAKREVGMSYTQTPSVDYDDTKNADTFAFCDPYYEYKMGLDTLAGDFMFYHDSDPSDLDIKYMQSMEQYIDYPLNREFNLNNLLVDGDKYNKIFKYLGGGTFDEVDDHFHISIDKEVILNRPMDGYPVPTLETTQDPHANKTALGKDTML